mgnify:CR=1 FL=1
MNYLALSYKKNKNLLEKTHNYTTEMEHDACGVGLIASTNGKKSRKIVETIFDECSFLEFGKYSGKSVIAGLARLDGWPVGVLASDPYFYGGGWTADASNKVTRFVDIAETFHLPVIHLVDNPGFVIGLEAEKQGTIRHGARALTAVYQATVPWCSVILRKVFGVAGAAHMNASRVHYRFAWPSGDWGSLPLSLIHI